VVTPVGVSMPLFVDASAEMPGHAVIRTNTASEIILETNFVTAQDMLNLIE
jgi:hypothetical protein